MTQSFESVVLGQFNIGEGRGAPQDPDPKKLPYFMHLYSQG